jgi:hypothetical protein
MQPAVTPSLIDRLTRRRRTVRALEPADMGTCFGMEQCLDEREADKPSVKAGKRSWLNRWLQGARSN